MRQALTRPSALCGLVLVVIGAIWVARMACTSVHCCLCRLQVPSSKSHDPGEELEFEEGDTTTPLRLRRPRSRSSTTRKREVGEGSAAEEEAEHGPTSEGETTLAAERIWEASQAKGGEKALRLRSSMARTMERKGGGSSSSQSLDLPSERVVQAA